MNLVILGIQWCCLQMKHHPLSLRKLFDTPSRLCLKEMGLPSISNSGCHQMNYICCQIVVYNLWGFKPNTDYSAK